MEGNIDRMALVLSRSNAHSTVPLHAEPSSEETDQLDRSAKKIKGDEKGDLIDEAQREYEKAWPSPSNREAASNPRPSFLDKLKGTEAPTKRVEKTDKIMEILFPDFVRKEKEESAAEEDMEEDFKVVEDPHRNFPEFVFSKRVKRRLYEAWQQSVIVKLLGRNIGFKALESRLQNLWAKQGVLTLIDIGNGYFIAKLSNREDFIRALIGGPWLIYDHYLTVRPWEPKFNPFKVSIEKVAVWVRFPLIPTEYYDEDVLTNMGNRLGTTLKVDMNTCCQLRGLFARVCVLMDLHKTFVSGFTIDGDEYYLEYEGLHLLCSKCGTYGHHSEKCSKLTEKMNQGPPNGDGGAPIITENVKGSPPECWKVVQKPRRQRKGKEKMDEQLSERPSGSRFDALVGLHEESTVVANKTNQEVVNEQPLSVRHQKPQSKMSKSKGKGAVNRDSARNEKVAHSTAIIIKSGPANCEQLKKVEQRVVKRARSEVSRRNDELHMSDRENNGPLLLSMGPDHEAAILRGEAFCRDPACNDNISTPMMGVECLEKSSLDPGDIGPKVSDMDLTLCDESSVDPLDSFVPETALPC